MAYLKHVDRDPSPQHLWTYAVTQWSKHARLAQETGDPIFSGHLLEYLRSEIEMLRDLTSFFDEFEEDWPDDLNLQCLQYACYFGFSSVVKRLIDSGLNINTKLCYSFGPPLCIASYCDHLPVVELLLTHGANVNGYGWWGSALQLASRNGSDRIVQRLLEQNADINFVPDDVDEVVLKTPLILALKRGHTSTMTLLLKNEADINAIGFEGNALLEALTNGHKEFVQILLQNGAYLEEINAEIPSPLQIAAEKGCMTMVTLLLDHGADVNRDTAAMLRLESRGEIYSHFYPIIGVRNDRHTCEYGLLGSALHAASANGHVDVAKLLIKRGADINARNPHWGTPLQLASERGQDAIIQLLKSLRR